MPKIADYFTKSDRKKLFFDYLKLVGILEIVIFIVVALWASDDKYHRVYTPFPWQSYLFVAFAFPILFTFLMGIIITGFNYFMGGDQTEPEAEVAGAADDRLAHVVNHMRRLPYLGLLFLLIVTILGLYNMDHIMAWVSSLGQKTFVFLSYALAALGVLVAFYMFFFMLFKYKLNKKNMQYQYYADISNKYGLIILDDRTVLHKNGNLLVQGKGWRKTRQVGKLPSEVQLLQSQPPAGSGDHLPMIKP